MRHHKEHKLARHHEHSSSAGWEKEGERLNAAYDPSTLESPERCDNGYDHNPFGFREGIMMAHGIRRGLNG